MASMTGKDIKVKHVDRDGKSRVQTHRVWDADLFIKTRQAELRKEVADDPKDKRPPGRVEIVI